MFCPECRTELSEDTKYCIKCGYDFTKIKTPPERKHTTDSPDTLDGSSTIYQPEIEADSFKEGLSISPVQVFKKCYHSI